VKKPEALPMPGARGITGSSFAFPGFNPHSPLKTCPVCPAIRMSTASVVHERFFHRLAAGWISETRGVAEGAAFSLVWVVSGQYRDQKTAKLNR
jgi:hypothetical protein